MSLWNIPSELSYKLLYKVKLATGRKPGGSSGKSDNTSDSSESPEIPGGRGEWEGFLEWVGWRGKDYCQEWEIDQLLQYCRCNFIFWFLLCFLWQNIRPKYAPPRRTNYTLKWRGGEAAPPIYFIFTPSRRSIFWSNFCLKKPTQKSTKSEILVHNYSSCLVSISLL